MQRTRVKICGITRVEDALAAASLGADAIGLVFYAPSPRAVDIGKARAICAALPPFVTTVGLFVNATEADIRAVLQDVPLDLLQFHGDESAEACGRYGRPYLKALRMREDIDLMTEVSGYADAAGMLLDSYHKAVQGGTGEAFDWARIPAGMHKPVVLAGGLGPDNVAEAIRQVRPYAVDVSSGVEQDKGIKDAARMAAFIQEVKRGDSI